MGRRGRMSEYVEQRRGGMYQYKYLPGIGPNEVCYPPLAKCTAQLEFRQIMRF